MSGPWTDQAIDYLFVAMCRIFDHRLYLCDEMHNSSDIVPRRHRPAVGTYAVLEVTANSMGVGDFTSTSMGSPRASQRARSAPESTSIREG